MNENVKGDTKDITPFIGFIGLIGIIVIAICIAFAQSVPKIKEKKYILQEIEKVEEIFAKEVVFSIKRINGSSTKNISVYKVETETGVYYTPIIRRLVEYKHDDIENQVKENIFKAIDIKKSKKSKEVFFQKSPLIDYSFSIDK